MKTIKEFLLDRTNNKAISADMENPHEFGCLVEPYNDAYDMFYEEFKDAMIIPDHDDPVLFFVTKDDAKENIKPNYMVRIYEVPEEYDTLKKFSEFEEGYTQGEITLEDLKQIKLEDL